MPMIPLHTLVPGSLHPASQAHKQNLVNHVGTITPADLEAKMAEAAKIHAREWERTAHPLDPMQPPEVHDWAIGHIAANLVARERGYDSGWDHDARRLASLVPHRAPIQPPRYAGEE